jgi:hypothetical protein
MPNPAEPAVEIADYEDASIACELPAGAPLNLQILGGAAEVRGRVVAIEGVDAGADADPRWGVTRVVVRGDPGEQEYELRLTLPRGVAAPLRVGERVVARARTQILGIHPVVDVTLIVDGELRLARSGQGAAATAPGWRIAPPAVRYEAPPQVMGMARRLDLPVLFRRAAGGPQGAVAGNLWRSLETGEAGGERWWISGHAVAWGPGMLPPDASTYFAFALVRGA